jgi:Uma2 family endonuclease
MQVNRPAQRLPIGVADYLEGEQASPIRHEYVAGQVFAMAGAGANHNRISLNIAFHLRSATRGTPCGVFISDMKVRVAAHDAFYYPDVLLTCDPTDRESLYKGAPCLIAEVLSPSTEVTDRREKLLAYRALEALRYYLLVSQDRRLVELYRRDGEGGWRYEVIEDGELAFDCGDLAIAFTLADIYEDVALETGEGQSGKGSDAPAR